MNQLSVAVVGGVLVYVVSQYIQRFILEPLLEYKKTTTDISHVLLLNQARILNGGPDEIDLKEKLHFLSARLRAFTKIIPFYDFLYKLRFFGLPQKENILAASHRLNLIGYGVIESGMPRGKAIENNIKAIDELRTLLNIETTYTDAVDEP